MKKKIFAAVLAVLTAASMAACGNGETDGNGGNDVPDVTVSEETTEADSETEENTETPSETVPETESETDTETETESETESETEDEDVDTAEAGDIYSGNGYTMTIDGEKWLDASEYLKLISEYSAELNTDLDVSAEDIQNMNDGMFYHTNQDGTNFNIVKTDVGDVGDMYIGDLSDVLKQQYEAAGMIWLDYEINEFDGEDWLGVYVETSLSGVDMKMLQYFAIKDGSEYVITYTAGKDLFDAGRSDFDEVMNSFKFSE